MLKGELGFVDKQIESKKQARLDELERANAGLQKINDTFQTQFAIWKLGQDEETTAYQEQMKQLVQVLEPEQPFAQELL